MSHPPEEAGQRKRRGVHRGAGPEDAVGSLFLRHDGGKSCPLPEGGDGNLLVFELDDFDGTVVGRLSDAVRIALEVGPLDDGRRLVAHAEHIGTEVLADTAESTLVVNPHF
jgi:hypothetical protein